MAFYTARRRGPTRRRLPFMLVLAAAAVAVAAGPLGSFGGPGDYLIMSKADFSALPTSGAAYTAVASDASGSWGTPDLCNQDTKHGVQVLAGALVAARTNDGALKAKVRDGIKLALPTQKDGCYNAVLSLGRQLGAYVFAADLISLSTMTEHADVLQASGSSGTSEVAARVAGVGSTGTLTAMAGTSSTSIGQIVVLNPR